MMLCRSARYGRYRAQLHERAIGFLTQPPAFPSGRPCTLRSLHGSSTSRAGNLFRAVTQRPEHLIGLRAWRSAEERPAKERIDIFPHDFSFFRHFKEAAEGRLGEECIAVGKALGDAHAR